MKKNFLYLTCHYLITLLIFLFIQKPIFIFYNWNHGGSELHFADLVQSYYHGMSLDLATAGYFTIIPFLLIWIRFLFPRFNPYRWIVTYDILLSLLLGIITLADASLYEFWEFKLDATVFMYLNDPKNAFASVTAGYIIMRVLAWLVLSALLAFLLILPAHKSRFSQAAQPPYRRLVSSLLMVVFGAVVFVLIRGTRIWPNTPGRAFYSKVSFHNHVALNPVFNIAYTWSHQQDFSKMFDFFPEEKRAALYQDLYPTEGTPQQYFLKNKRPNVLVVVLEGFGAVFIESLGGMKEVAPNISRISQEGVLFTNCHCNSFRTDRGIVSAISGYLAQPTTSIMRYTHKVQSLPGLPKTLKKYGYSTQALYGGDVTFFNMSDYLIASGHDKLVSQTDFPQADRSTKWGVPDHKTFEWLYNDIQKKDTQKEGPWYTTFLTLSSHTPFDVPYHRLADEKLNAFAYTDSCFGAFIDKIKETPAWDNLLIVCVADHGFNHKPVASPEFPHIPMLWLGGALNTPSAKIDKIVSQTDLPATVLGQMDIPHKDFTFSRDVLADTYRYPFAFNTFNNGFIFRDSTGCIVYDNNAQKALFGADKAREEKGKAILQTLYDDLSTR